jgi:hypothetical protein
VRLGDRVPPAHTAGRAHRARRAHDGGPARVRVRSDPEGDAASARYRARTLSPRLAVGHSNCLRTRSSFSCTVVARSR